MQLSIFSAVVAVILATVSAQDWQEYLKHEQQHQEPMDPFWNPQRSESDWNYGLVKDPGMRMI